MMHQSRITPRPVGYVPRLHLSLPVDVPRDPNMEFARGVLIRVADHYGVAVGQITGKGRSLELVNARDMVATVLRARGWSLPQIGHVLGGRDHSTVRHLLERHALRMNRGAKA